MHAFPLPEEQPTAPIKSGHYKKKMRNKTVSEQNKQQKAIIEQHKKSEKQEPVNGTLGDVADRIAHFGRLRGYRS